MAQRQYWIDLERVAAMVLTELNPDLRVTHNAHLPGQLTQIHRQIDVLMEDPEGSIRIVVDCKDWTRPVTAPQAGAFASLLEDVEATSGILICNRGFSAAAANLARSKGFRLATLHDVSPSRWQVNPLVPALWRRFWLKRAKLSIRIGVDAPGDFDTRTSGQLVMDGEPIDVIAHIENSWLKGEMRGNKVGVIWFPNLDYVDRSSGTAYPADVFAALEISSFARLGNLVPVRARGVVDYESACFFTAHLDLVATVQDPPVGGWQDLDDDVDEVVARTDGSIVTITEIVPVRLSVDLRVVPTERQNLARPPDECEFTEMGYRHQASPFLSDYRRNMVHLESIDGDPTREARLVGRRRMAETRTNLRYLINPGLSVNRPLLSERISEQHPSKILPR